MFEPEDDRREPGEPAKPGERLGVIAFAALFAFALAMEVGAGDSPAKWSIPLMALCWVPLLILHEAGHAVVARLLGWRVERVVIGFGSKWLGLRVAGIPIELRSLPVEGFVEMVPHDGVARSLPHAAIYFAGPGVELLLALGLLLAFGSERFLQVTADPGLLMAQSLALAAALGAVINLIPHSTIQGDREIPNDGLGILWALRGPQR